MDFVLFYVTCKDAGEAKNIGKSLLKERLIACCNIFPEMSSFFWWNGKIDEAKEAVVILKTKKTLSQKVIKRIKELHSYECPCIVEIPITSGYRKFLDWIEEETIQQ